LVWRGDVGELELLFEVVESLQVLFSLLLLLQLGCLSF